MLPGRWITLSLLVLTLCFGAGLTLAPQGPLSFLTGQSALASESLDTRETTQIASVLEHTAREREYRGQRAEAARRLEAGNRGYTLNRVLEIALHPVFLLVLMIPLIRRARPA